VINDPEDDKSREVSRRARQSVNSFQSARYYGPVSCGSEVKDNFGKRRSVNSQRQITVVIKSGPRFHFLKGTLTV
jgi:hypothetical protein